MKDRVSLLEGRVNDFSLRIRDINLYAEMNAKHTRKMLYILCFGLFSLGISQLFLCYKVYFL